MQLSILQEPDLAFSAGQQHIDVRYGLMNYGPVDIDRTRDRKISLGIVGTSETISGLREWLLRIDQGVDAKASPRPHFFPRFPGISGNGAFGCSMEIESRHERQITQRAVREIIEGSEGSQGERVRAFVQMLMEEVRYIGENNAPPAVTLVALPAEAEALLGAQVGTLEGEAEGDAATLTVMERSEALPDLHDLLKASAMAEKRIIQVVWPPTYDSSKAKMTRRNPARIKALQDEATRAWNLSTALYYKAGFTPWRLLRRHSDFSTLHVGVCFYRSLDGEKLNTSLAQVFDERGDGTIIRGGAAIYDKDDRQPHLDEAAAEEILSRALRSYRREHRTLPARVVIHKSSSFSLSERVGFHAAADSERVDLLELVSIGEPKARLFRQGAFPPLRGTLLHLGSRQHLLYTRGSVDFFEMYPGMYVPRPLGIVCEDVEAEPRALAEEILALTKMNWNNTQFDGRLPITIRAARQVSSVLRYVSESGNIEAAYRYYM